MKCQIIFLITIAFSLNVNAQNIEDSKQYFQQAKVQLENMLSDKEKPNYEKAIFTIENAWYDNQIDKANFDNAMNKHIETIQELIKNNYDEKAITQKPSLLITQQEIKDQYKQALTNWAIYTYITRPTLFVDNKDTNTISFHRPYKYSTTDPMATTHWQNSQVVNLNNTHMGNCYALASFFKILADRLNSDATLCTAPSHIYISHKDDKGTDYNIELGSKYFPGTGMISALTYTTDQAIKSGISQRKLDSKKSLALCLVYLAKGYQYKFSNTSDEFILQCANTAIQYDPKNLNALLLKSEYLENKLIAQKKSFAQLQTQTDFKEYQNFITNLDYLGYREMPLEMKNTLIKTYKHEPINKELPKFQTDKGKFATLSWGIFDERHTNKTTERIGNTIFNTKSNKIVSFAKDQILYNNYNFDPVVFAWNIDPLANKYPDHTPYHFASNSPIAYVDKHGLERYFAADGKYLGKWGNSDDMIILVVKGNGLSNNSLMVDHMKASPKGTAPLAFSEVSSNTQSAVAKTVFKMNFNSKINSVQSSIDDPRTLGANSKNGNYDINPNLTWKGEKLLDNYYNLVNLFEHERNHDKGDGSDGFTHFDIYLKQTQSSSWNSTTSAFKDYEKTAAAGYISDAFGFLNNYSLDKNKDNDTYQFYVGKYKEMTTTFNKMHGTKYNTNYEDAKQNFDKEIQQNATK